MIGRPAPAAPPAPPAVEEADPDGHLQAERRMREAGGPEDTALYRCSCGYAFEADVSTSVACPHCGTGQAW
ncbi:MAG: zinc ribbon domain-containing protein [Solirubrobacterales bacterium]|nr:zinc ribbon domain-containing protein [Solirubrobacterales bacterium]